VLFQSVAQVALSLQVSLSTKGEFRRFGGASRSRMLCRTRKETENIGIFPKEK
jgi:hypothetical protein